MGAELKDQLYGFFINADKEGAVNLLEHFAEANGYEEAVKEILEPALAEFGDHWTKVGDISLAHGYIVGKIAEEILTKAADEKVKNFSDSNEIKGKAIMGNIEDDFHSLGRKLVATFLKASGWEVYDLGNDVPAEEFISKALEVEASVIGVSAMMYTTAVNIKKVRVLLDERNLSGKIKLAVGGAIFRLRPSLLEEVGGDGTVGNALQAPELFTRLSNSIK